MSTRVRLRSGTRNQWVSVNPTLSAGEMGVELPTPGSSDRRVKFKIGPGAWNLLPYQDAASVVEDAVGLAALVTEDIERREFIVTDDGDGGIEISYGGVSAGTWHPEGGVWSGIAGKPEMLVGLDVYNWAAKNTRRLQRSMAKAMAGQAADHLVFGDSTSSGYVGSMNYPAAWPWVLRGLLSQRGVPLGGTGWVFPCHGASYEIDPRWSRVGGSWARANGYIWSVTPGDVLTFESDMPGEIVKVALLHGSGPVGVSIDGRAGVTATPPAVAGGMNDVYTYTSGTLADDQHKLAITVQSDQPTHILGAGVFRSKGLQVHNFSRIGQNATQFRQYTSIPQRGWVANRLALDPDVIHIALGVNDLDYSQSIGDTIAAITDIRNDWPNADVILHAQAAPSPAASVPTPPSDATWTAFVAALYALADTLDCPLVDWYRLTGGSYAAAAAAGLMGDAIHPNALAEALFARTIGNAMTQKVGN